MRPQQRLNQIIISESERLLRQHLRYSKIAANTKDHDIWRKYTRLANEVMIQHDYMGNLIMRISKAL